jgi:hypothetical protein
VRKVFAAAGFKDEAAEEVEGSELSVEGGKQAGEGDGAALAVVVVEGNGAVAHRGDIHAERRGGLRRASVRDFHSFRVTWVTLALTAGVPLELVQKVTGHKTTDIVLKHYFQPGREDFRKALQSAMPKLLTNGQKSPKDEMRELLKQTKPKVLRERLQKLLEKI